MSERLHSYPGFGEVSLRPFDIESDPEFLHGWVQREYAFFWGLQGKSKTAVREEYERLLARPAYEVWVGEFNELPAFVLEVYDPGQDELGEHYSVQPGDCGLHLIVAPRPRNPLPDFTWYMFRASLGLIFSRPDTERVVVEPDIRNKKMFALCERLGFRLDRVVELSHKTAQLAFIDRQRHDALRQDASVRRRKPMNTIDRHASPHQAVEHLTMERWLLANQLLLAKALQEFSHERLIRPETDGSPDEDGYARFSVQNDEGTAYRFRAKTLPLEHLLIVPDSIHRVGTDAPADVARFIKDFRGPLGISDNFLPYYLEEIMSTLQGSAYKMAKGNPSSRELAHADFQTIEQSMTEGHPCFVANNGRIGFDSGDYRAFAPEAGNTFNVLWLAGHKDHAIYAGGENLDYQTLIDQELDADTQKQFSATLQAKGVNPDDYLFLPIHPYQWFNKLASVFASEIASGQLICLGYGKDQYLAQQSVRTLFNTSRPERFYVKSALSILNMGFMRGLPLYYLGTAPVMAAWLEDLLYRDPVIEKSGFRMLSEVASVSYVNETFEEFGPHNDFNKMLASLWRESPTSVLAEGQTPMTMAALLHVDDDGEAMVDELVARSGLSHRDWLDRYFDAYLVPLLHCFFAYDLVFMPHGENIVLVTENGVPVRALLKDITEEAAILNPEVELPKGLERLYCEVPEDMKPLSIFIDIFDDFFRLLAAVLERSGSLSATEFWECVASSVQRYQDAHPELRRKFDCYDLFCEEFQLSCLNRLQIRNHRQMIDLDEPVAKLQLAGPIANPIAPFRPGSNQRRTA